MLSLQKVKKLIYVGFSSATFLATKAFAQQSSGTINDVERKVEEVNPGLNTNLTEQIRNIINLLIIIIGIVAVIMLVVGGFRYVFSQGNEKNVQSAKDTILYAIIGIVVAVLAFAIVNFVLSGLGGTPTN